MPIVKPGYKAGPKSGYTRRIDRAGGVALHREFQDANCKVHAYTHDHCEEERKNKDLKGPLHHPRLRTASILQVI
jgi:hypothetical protein